MKVVYFGTPVFAANVLSFLVEHKVDIVAVITKPDRPKGRSGDPIPTPVKLQAQAHNIPVFQPPIVSAPEFAEVIASFGAELFVVVAYGEIIKQHLLDMPARGCINLHASLLPKYRGAAPIQRSIMEGEEKTGVTVMHMVRKMDAGDIIKVVEIPITPQDTFIDVEQRLWMIGSQALLEVIRDFEAGMVQRIPQDHTQATYAAKIELEDCEVLWALPAQKLHNLIRGVTPDPGAWCYVMVRGQKKRLRIIKAEVIEFQSRNAGDILCYGKEGLVVACGHHALRILELQLEGKKAMLSEELMKGISISDFSFL